MAKNIPWDDRTNAKTPTGTTSEADASIYNSLKAWNNAPGKPLGAFSPTIVFDSQGEYNAYTLTGNETWTANIDGIFNVRLVTVTTPGGFAITLGSGFSVDYNGLSGTVLDAGTYDIWMSATTAGVKVAVPQLNGSAPSPVAPTITSSSVENSEPNKFIVNFSEAVTSTIAGWTLRINGTPTTGNVISNSGTSTLTFTVNETVLTGQTLTLDYDSGAGDCVSVSSSTPLASVTGFSVTNNVGATQLTAPTITLATAGETQVTLDFTNPNGGNEDDNLVEYKLDTEPTVWTAGVVAVTGATQAIQTGLTNGLLYDFRITARGSGGFSDSPPSAEVSATPDVTSIIVMDDDFTGTTIDTGKWAITNPDSIISQNDSLLFTYSGTAPANRSNYLASLFATGTTFAVQCTGSGVISGTQRNRFWLNVWDGTSDNEIQLANRADSSDHVRLIIRQGGVSQYDFLTTISQNNTFKIVRQGDDVSFYYWNAAWVQIGSTQTVTGLPTSMTPTIMASSGTAVGSCNVDDYYQTNANYNTAVPV